MIGMVLELIEWTIKLMIVFVVVMAWLIVKSAALLVVLVSVAWAAIATRQHKKADTQRTG